MPLGRKIFVGTALVVVAALGSALLVTRTRTNAAAEAASARALRATRSAISDALASRSQNLRQLTAALVQVPAYVSRIGEALRTDDRSVVRSLGSPPHQCLLAAEATRWSI